VDQTQRLQKHPLEQVDLEQEHMDLLFFLELLDKEVTEDKMMEQIPLDLVPEVVVEQGKQDKVILLVEVHLEEQVYQIQ